ncbi:DUF4440 domain-containing protein [soil metagenome]
MMHGLVALVLVASAPVTPQVEIMTVMEASAAGWNAGDIDRFTAAYAIDATFVGRDGLVQGRAAIADRYRPSFTGGGNERGKLTFQALAFRPLSKVHVLLCARWTLTKDAATKPETGMTTLLFERRAEGWRIISDHSS